MPTYKKILVLNGSTRINSTNLKFIKAVSALSAEYFSMCIFNGLTHLPHFNPDLDIENAPESVFDFRRHLKEADGILICTPEYAFGIPGTLKNAIDWTVSSGEFYDKPLALITASTSGEKSHAAFLDVLKAVGTRMSDETQLLISNAKTKINADNIITDSETSHKLTLLIAAFNGLMSY